MKKKIDFLTSLTLSRNKTLKDIIRQHQILTCMWSNRNSHSLLVEVKMVQPFQKTVQQFLTKLNQFLLSSSANVLLDTYPKQLKSYVGTKTYTGMFTDTLFTTAKTWKQLSFPPAGEWINTLWYTQIRNIIQC